MAARIASHSERDGGLGLLEVLLDELKPNLSGSVKKARLARVTEEAFLVEPSQV
mgnify:CR=1 FL=1